MEPNSSKKRKRSVSRYAPLKLTESSKEPANTKGKSAKGLDRSIASPSNHAIKGANGTPTSVIVSLPGQRYTLTKLANMKVYLLRCSLCRRHASVLMFCV